jgi:hypothetical protein
MYQGSTNNQVVDLAAYRQKRQPGGANVSQEILEDAEVAIEEIAQYLLQAIRIVTARYRHRH